MSVMFEKSVLPFVANDVTLWHLEHGWIWNVTEIRPGSDFRRLGVFYATLLCGDGCIIHFDTCPGVRIAPSVILASFRKGIRLAAAAGLNVIYATIPEEKRILIRIMERLGFRIAEHGGFLRDGQPVALLKYSGQ